MELYVGLDPANISIEQARDRYGQMRSRGGGGRGRRPQPALFHAEFATKDCFGESLADVDIIQRVGFDPNAGPGGSLMASRWGGGGFDVVTSMFAIHYAFESEEKARQMLSNVAGCLKKGGRFIGVCPNSDVITSKVSAFHKKRKEQETTKPAEPEGPEDVFVSLAIPPKTASSVHPSDGSIRTSCQRRLKVFLNTLCPGRRSEREFVSITVFSSSLLTVP